MPKAISHLGILIAMVRASVERVARSPALLPGFDFWCGARPCQSTPRDSAEQRMCNASSAAYPDTTANDSSSNIRRPRTVCILRYGQDASPVPALAVSMSITATDSGLITSEWRTRQRRHREGSRLQRVRRLELLL